MKALTDKYRLIENESMSINGQKVYRIQAIRDIRIKRLNIIVKSGSRGGYVSGYHNLSQDNNCWIDEDAIVYENATVISSGYVGGNSIVFGNAIVRKFGTILGDAIVCGDKTIIDGTVSDCAVIMGGYIGSNCFVGGVTFVNHTTKIVGHTVIGIDRNNGKYKARGNFIGNTLIYGNVTIDNVDDYGRIELDEPITISDVHVSFTDDFNFGDCLILENEKTNKIE